MHPKITAQLAQELVAERHRRAQLERKTTGRHRPPPLRRHAAHVVALIARRLDVETARRAIV